MSDPRILHIIGRTAPGPGPITTAAQYWLYWEEAGKHLRDAAQPGVPVDVRIALRDLAWELIGATKQVVNNPPLCAEIGKQIEARLEERARAEGWIV